MNIKGLCVLIAVVSPLLMGLFVCLTIASPFLLIYGIVALLVEKQKPGKKKESNLLMHLKEVRERLEKEENQKLKVDKNGFSLH